MAALIGFGSDVARLVLGYLQEEKLHQVSRAFCRESPYLQEEWGTLSHSFNMSNETTLLNRLREHMQIKYLVSQFVDGHLDRYMDHPLVNELSTLRRIEMILLATDLNKIRCAEKRRFSEIHDQSSRSTSQPDDLNAALAKKPRLAQPFEVHNETTPSLQNAIPKCNLSSIKKPTTPLSTITYRGPTNSTITSNSMSFLNDQHKFSSPEEPFYCDPSLLSNSMFQNTAFQNVIVNAINDRRLNTPHKDSPNSPDDVEKMIADIIATTEQDPTFEDVVKDCVQSIRLNHSNRAEPDQTAVPVAKTSTPQKSESEESVASSVQVPIKQRLRNRKSTDSNMYLDPICKRPYRKSNMLNTSKKSNAASDIQVISNETYTGDIIVLPQDQPSTSSGPIANVLILNQDTSITHTEGVPTYFVYNYQSQCGLATSTSEPGLVSDLNQIPVTYKINDTHLLKPGDVINLPADNTTDFIEGPPPDSSVAPIAKHDEQFKANESDTKIPTDNNIPTTTVQPIPSEAETSAINPVQSTNLIDTNDQTNHEKANVAKTPKQVSQLNQCKAKSLSTPRRHSHVRTLNFSTPFQSSEPATDHEGNANMTPAYSKGELNPPASAPPKIGYGPNHNEDSDNEAPNKSGSLDETNDFFSRDIDEATVVSVTDLSIPNAPVEKSLNAVQPNDQRSESTPKSDIKVTPSTIEPNANKTSSKKQVANKVRPSQKKAPPKKPKEQLPPTIDVDAKPPPPDVVTKPLNQLDEWQRLRSIKSNDWDNHLRQELSRTGATTTTGRRNITKRRKKKLEPLQNINSSNGSIESSANDSSIVEHAKKLDAALVTPAKSNDLPAVDLHDDAHGRQKKIVIKLATPSKSTKKHKKSVRKKSEPNSALKESTEKIVSTSKEESFIHPDNITPPDLKRPPHPTPANQGTVHMNLASLLETPLKYDIPPTPRLLEPCNQGSPVVRIKRLDESMIKCTEFPTPSFPITPGANTTTTPHQRSNSNYGRATDYSSGSSYYRPDESEDIDHNITAGLQKTFKDRTSTADQYSPEEVNDKPIDGDTLQQSINTSSSSSSSSSSSNSSSSDSSSSESSSEDDSDDDCHAKEVKAEQQELEHDRLREQKLIEENNLRLLEEQAHLNHLEEVRKRTLANIKKDSSTERFRAQATLAQRKGKLAVKQGLAAAVAASKQKPNMSEARRVVKKRIEPVVTRKTPAKRVVASPRKVICLKEAIPTKRTRSNSTKAGQKLSPKKESVKAMQPPVVLDSTTTSSKTTHDKDKPVLCVVTPPKASTYSPNAVDSHSDKIRDLFGDFTLSDSDFMETPVKNMDDDRRSEVLPALSLMPTPQKKKTTPQKTADESGDDLVIKKSQLSKIERPEVILEEGELDETPLKTGPSIDANDSAQITPLQKSKASVSLMFDEIQRDNGAAGPKQLLVEPPKAAQTRNIESKTQTVCTSEEGIKKTPDPIKLPAKKRVQNDDSDMPAGPKVSINPNEIVNQLHNDQTNYHSPAGSIAKSSCESPPVPQPVEQAQPIQQNRDESDGESSSSEEIDPYDECSLAPASNRSRHVDEFCFVSNSTHISLAPTRRHISFPVFKINMDGHIFNLSVTPESLVFAQAPHPVHSATDVAPTSNMRTKTKSLDQVSSNELGRPLKCSTPAERKPVPRMKITHKKKGDERNRSPVPPKESSTKPPTTPLEPAATLRSLAVDPTPKIRNMDINLVLGKIHPSTSQQ